MEIKSKPHSDRLRWMTIYPLYINSNKTVGQGRRILKHKAIANPTSQEIFNVLSHVGLQCELEQNKMHPRELLRDPAVQGRVRVQLRNDDGTPAMAQFPTREALMMYAAEMIPNLKTRQGSGQQQQQNSAGGANPGGGGQKQKKRR